MSASRFIGDGNINANETRQIQIPLESIHLKKLINNEFNRLKGVTYLDHAGTTLYAESQLRSVFDELSANVYGNPHSRSASSKLSTDIVDQVRIRVAQHFNTTLDEYSVIFTSGATGACKLIGEAFVWSDRETGTGGHFMYLEDNHTSVLGIRNLASEFGATSSCLQINETFKKLKDFSYRTKQTSFIPTNRKPWNCLVAFPAQSNFCGRKYPPIWIDKIRRGALLDFVRSEQDAVIRWSVALDAAALVGTSSLDLNQLKPDFVFLSFHKMFGFPTGLGALLVHRNACDLMPGRYFGGGTVLVSLAHEKFQLFRKSLSERFEAGTVSFLDILAVRHGLDYLQKITGSTGTNDDVMKLITRHTFRLARSLHHYLDDCRHQNGSRIAIMYCSNDFENIATQGAIVNFNLLRDDGQYVGFAEVEKMAAVYDIQFRTGCMCNPGACQKYLELTVDDIKHHLEAGHVCGDDLDLIDGRPTGAIRVSFGYMNTDDDVDRLLHMIKVCFITSKEIDVAPNLMTENSCDSKWTDRSTLKQYFGSYITNIYLYPLKSCGAFEVSSWPLTSRGFLFDRQWMVLTDGGVVLTQKREPNMCLIRPEIDLEHRRLYLHFKGVSSISISLEINAEIKREDSASKSQSKVCGDRIKGIDCGDEVSDWLSVIFGRSGCRLVRQPPDSNRKCRQKTGDSKKGVDLSLANQAQYLLLNRSSAAVIHRSLGENTDGELSVDRLLGRFRGNLIVDGAQPFTEDLWTRIYIGQHQYIVQGPCSRCQMICIDQETAARSTDTLLTLSAVRERKMTFGIYLYCVDDILNEKNENVLINVGDRVNPIL